jgi:Ni,Fe-hydrogenase III small subunit
MGNALLGSCNGCLIEILVVLMILTIIKLATGA